MIPADINEAPRNRELPASLARRLASEKATSVSLCERDAFILAGDTVVAAGRRILGKPSNEAEAIRFLKLLSGRRHKIYGGICVLAPDGRRVDRVVVTTVAFKRLTRHEIMHCLGDAGWEDRAAGYAIQGRAGAFVTRISGSYSNAVGLALHDTCSILGGLGYRLFSDHRERAANAGP